MITKTGSSMVKEALLGAVIGDVRANNLSSDQRATLEEEYGLPANASLGWRNAGRGFVGSNLGSLGANLLASAVTKGNGRFGPFPGIAGGLIGAKLMTDKYSRGNAERILARKRKPDVPMSVIENRAREYGLDGDALKGLLAYYQENPNARKNAFS